MKRSRSGIKICRAEPEAINIGGGRLSCFCLQMTVLCILMIVWWNALLSIFHMPFKRGYLYVCTCILIIILGWAGHKFRGKAAVAALAASAAVLWLYRDIVVELCTWTAGNYPSLLSEYTKGRTDFSLLAAAACVPVIELLLAVQRKGRGKGWAGIVFAAPFLAAAAAGHFQAIMPAWLLVVGSTVYFASSAPGAYRSGKRLFIWKYTAAAVLISVAAALISFYAGKILDVQREAENGYYLKVRSAIQTELIEGVQDLLSKAPEDDRKSEEHEENDSEIAQSTEQNDPAQETENPPAGEDALYQEGLFSSGDSGMDDLGSLAYFRPAEGQLGTVEADEKPGDTVYLAKSWGITYSDNGWSEIDLTMSVVDDSPEMLRKYRDYPKELEDTLRNLCEGWDTGSAGEVGTQISRELSERAAYDTSPGATPAGEDFVEYFLFENHKGFCVHFATAATLMYRYCGYTARYVEGYAVPASAFEKNNESGKYEAAITGDMGHAWCQVYDGQTMTWKDAEHTPPAPEGISSGQPAASFAGEQSEEDGRIFVHVPVWLIVSAGIAVFAVLLFFGQAGIRSARRERRFYEKTCGKGIREMYAAVVRTAQFQGIAITDPLGENTAGCLAEAYEELEEEEWTWIYTRVMESMFYHTSDDAGNWKEMHRLYIRFRKAAYSRMKPAEKWRFRYVWCL